MAHDGAARRPPLLAALLRRRAVAAAAGLDDLEAMLREQILDGLPLQRGSATGDRPVQRNCEVPTAPAAPPPARAPMPPVATNGIQRGWGDLALRSASPAAPVQTRADRGRGLSLFGG